MHVQAQCIPHPVFWMCTDHTVVVLTVLRAGHVLSAGAAVHLLAADRPQPRRPSGARDCTHLQDRQAAVRGDSTRVDTQVCDGLSLYVWPLSSGGTRYVSASRQSAPAVTCTLGHLHSSPSSAEHSYYVRDTACNMFNVVKGLQAHGVGMDSASVYASSASWCHHGARAILVSAGLVLWVWHSRDGPKTRLIAVSQW